jgi:hypothetical protein
MLGTDPAWEGALPDPDVSRAVQAEPGPPSPYPAVAAQGASWPNYEASLRQRGSLTVWFTEEAVAAKDFACNITPDRETGLGQWTDDQIKRALTQGECPDGRRLASPMPVAYLARLKPDDLDALVVWLQSLKPIRNQITR